MKFSHQAKRIASRYLIEKADYLKHDSSLADDNFSCWKGWHEDIEDFEMWAQDEGISREFIMEAWGALQCLMGK